MATTKLFPITATERKAISYIADGSKTDNGRLISTFCCSSDPAQASRDFASVRACGTGKNKILSQHFIQSFKPGEITPERALEVGEELCEKFLKGQYQYYLAVHVDKAHVHLHVIFNNCNMYDYKTFETHEDQGSKKERAWKKLFDLSDEICKRHHLSVIQHPELGKGKKRWEWMLHQQGLSWKTKLKKAIDQVVMNSEDFEDFLAKCADYGVIVDYNPDHKIDLKFMLAERKESNPNARFTRARTLGAYYETENIKKRIAQYIGGMMYVPRTKVRMIVQKPQNKFVQDAIDRGNMKIASIAKNIIAQYGIEPDDLEPEIQKLLTQREALYDEIQDLKEKVKDLKGLLKALAAYKKLKPIHDELESLKGRKRKKYQDEHFDELRDYYSAEQELDSWFDNKKYESESKVKEVLTSYQEKLTQKEAEHDAVHAKFVELRRAQSDIDAYLRQYAPQTQQDEQLYQQEQKQQKKKNKNVLE